LLLRLWVGMLLRHQLITRTTTRSGAVRLRSKAPTTALTTRGGMAFIPILPLADAWPMTTSRVIRGVGDLLGGTQVSLTSLSLDPVMTIHHPVGSPNLNR